MNYEQLLKELIDEHEFTGALITFLKKKASQPITFPQHTNTNFMMRVSKNITIPNGQLTFAQWLASKNIKLKKNDKRKSKFYQRYRYAQKKK